MDDLIRGNSCNHNQAPRQTAGAFLMPERKRSVISTGRFRSLTWSKPGARNNTAGQHQPWLSSPGKQRPFSARAQPATPGSSLKGGHYLPRRVTRTATVERQRQQLPMVVQDRNTHPQWPSDRRPTDPRNGSPGSRRVKADRAGCKPVHGRFDSYCSHDD